MRRPFLLCGLILLNAALASASPSSQVILVEPACPEVVRPQEGKDWRDMPGPVVKIRYDANHGRARIQSPSNLEIVYAANGSYWRGNTGAALMREVRHGIWEAEFQLKPEWLFLIFYVRDGKVRDTNRGEYWDFVLCHNGKWAGQAGQFRAGSYAGDIVGPGIQRRPDLPRAIRVLEEQARQENDPLLNQNMIWTYKFYLYGGGNKARQRVAREVERFLEKRKGDENALRTAMYFVSWGSSETARLEAQLERYITARGGKLLEDLRRHRAEAAVRKLRDPKQSIPAALAFAREYPDSFGTGTVLMNALQDAKYSKDVAGAEQLLEMLAKYNPEDPQPLVFTAEWFAREKLLDRAGQLLDTAAKLDAKKRAPNRPMYLLVGRDVPGAITIVRAQLLLASGNTAQALNALESIRLKFKPSQMMFEGEFWMLLGSAQESTGDYASAAASYIEAATDPLEEVPDANEALHRVYQRGLGTAEELERALAARRGERRRQIAADYTPEPVSYAAPKISYVTMSGKRVRAKHVAGKTVVINFWATWCGPCIHELVDLQRFQQERGDVHVVAIVANSERADILKVLKERNITALDVGISEQLYRDLSANAGVPYTVVIDKDRQVRFAHSGALADVSAILNKDLAYLEAEQAEVALK